MNRLYVFINVQNGTAEQVVQSLQCGPGVLLADVVESPSDVIMVVEANDNLKLAEFTIKALAPVENMIEGLQLSPVQETRGKLEAFLAYRKN